MSARKLFQHIQRLARLVFNLGYGNNGRHLPSHSQQCSPSYNLLKMTD